MMTSLFPPPERTSGRPLLEPTFQHTHRIASRLLVPGLLAVFASGVTSAATLSVSPAAITNDFAGTVMLSIGGLPDADPVRVERFLDANRDGAVDGGDWLLSSQLITDGRVSRIGGVRDGNRPGDEDGLVDGQMTVALPAWSFTEFERGVGHYLFRLSSPTARFGALAQPFEVRDYPHGQWIEGVVRTAGAPEPAALVAVLDPSNEFVAAVAADEAGAYRLEVPVGDYLVLAVKRGRVTESEGATFAAVTAGATITADLSLVMPTHTLSGQVLDADSREPQPGMMIFAESEDGSLAPAFTDAAGQLSIPVSAGIWGLEVSEIAAMAHGLLSSDAPLVVDATAGDVSGVELLLPRGTALVTGTLKTTGGTPLVGIRMNVDSEALVLIGHGVTTTGGQFWMVGAEGEWWAGASQEQLGALGFSHPHARLSLSSNQVVNLDLVAQAYAARIQGRVILPDGTPAGDLGVNAYTFTGLYTAGRTAADGSFDLGVAAGSWQFSLDDDEARERGLIAPAWSLMIEDGQTNSGNILIARPVRGHVTGSVSVTGVGPLPGIPVYGGLNVGGTNYYVTDVTDIQGAYDLGVSVGTWWVGLECNALTLLGYPCQPQTNLTVTLANPALVQDFVIQPYSDAPPTFSSLTHDGGYVGFSVIGELGRTYRVEASSDLVGWDAVMTNQANFPVQTNQAYGSFSYGEPMSPGVPRFFRAALVP